MATTKEDITESIQKELKLSINQSAELIETFMEIKKIGDRCTISIIR